MTRLSDEPAPPPASLDEVMAIAGAMETEAVRLYQSLADEMTRQGADTVAAVFLRLVVMERAHVREVEALSGLVIGAPPPWSPGGAAEVWTHVARPAGDEAASTLLTPYRALSIAVRAEERAFAFYSYVAAGTVDASIRRVAETLAREELRHAAELRIHRRTAWRRERGAGPSAPVPVPDTVADLSALAAALDREVSRRLAALGGSLERARGAAGPQGAVPLAFPAARLALGQTADGSGADAVASALLADVRPEPAPVRSTRDVLQGAVRLLERLCDIYGAIAERSPHEPVLTGALGLAEAALDALVLARERVIALDAASGEPTPPT